MGGGFGGMGGGPMASRLAIFIAIASVLVAIAGRTGFSLSRWLLFHPADVLRGMIWQPFTWALFVPLHHPGAIFGFLITLYLLYALGGQVESVLGSRRFIRAYLAITVVSALITTLVYLVLGWPPQQHSGVWVGLSALIILFAHHFAHQPIYLFFVLPVQGRQLILISYGILALYAIIGSVGQVFPEFLGMTSALLWARGGVNPRRSWLRFRAWKIERELKRRHGRFSVIRGGADKDRRREEKGPFLH